MSEAEFLPESIPTKSSSKCSWVFWPEHNECDQSAVLHNSLGAAHESIHNQRSSGINDFTFFYYMLLISRTRSLSSKYLGMENVLSSNVWVDWKTVMAEMDEKK